MQFRIHNTMESNYNCMYNLQKKITIWCTYMYFKLKNSSRGSIPKLFSSPPILLIIRCGDCVTCCERAHNTSAITVNHDLVRNTDSKATTSTSRTNKHNGNYHELLNHTPPVSEFYHHWSNEKRSTYRSNSTSHQLITRNGQYVMQFLREGIRK